MKQTFYKPLGFMFLGLAILGVLLPILPGTPFVLLSAWFFARSSEKWHRRLLDSELTGPVIRDWEENQCMSCRLKVFAILSMVLAGGASVIFAVEVWWARAISLGLMAIGSVTILSIKTCDRTLN